MKLHVVTQTRGGTAWRAIPKFTILAVNLYPHCAKCGHTYIEHTRIHACGVCLCDGYAGRTT